MIKRIKMGLDVLKRIGITKIDIGIIGSFILIMLSVLSLFIYMFLPFMSAFIIFEIINITFFGISCHTFKLVRSSLNKEGYSTIFKEIVPKICAIVNYVLICSIPLPQLFGAEEWCSFVGNIYIFTLYIVIMIYAISMSVSYTYSRKYKKEKIGNFYDAFISKKFDLGKINNIIKDEKALNVLIRPKYFKANEKIDGKMIVQNLISLKKFDISTYFRLKSKIKLKANSHFWNLVSVAVGLGSIFIALYSRNFFNDLIQGFVKGTNSVKMSNFFFETAISCIFVIVMVMVFKYSAKEVNKGFYEGLLMYFEESEKEES